MIITLATVADAANVSQQGKLNVLGAFDTIRATQFPAVHPTMSLVFSMLAEVEDSQTEFDLNVSLIDEDGQKLWSAQGKVEVASMVPGQFGQSSQIITLTNVRFDKPGRYRFRISEGPEKAPTDVVLRVVETDPGSPR